MSLTLEEQLAQLRKDWKRANGTMRKLILQRATLIKWAIEARDDSTVKDVKDALGIHDETT